MDDFGDSGELYTIRNQFYTNQHHRVQAYELESFSKEHQLKVVEFQIRSTIALEQDASELIEKGKRLFPQNEAFFQLLEAYDDLKLFGTDNSTYFEDVKVATFELQAVLTAIYLVKFDKDIDQAITFLTQYIDSSSNQFQLEPFLVLVQLYLVQGKFSQAINVFDSLKKISTNVSDNIIYEVIASWIQSIKGETENINNSYYFYDELLSTDFEDDNQSKFRILNVLFVLTLQLKHYPEAEQILKQIDQLNPKPNSDFIANKITYDYLVHNGENVPKLLSQLQELHNAHPLLLDLKEKNKSFDEVVLKYLQLV
jgi:coatomer protein complex subunit epsilon